MLIVFDMPMPPSCNRLYRSVRTCTITGKQSSRIIKSHEYRKFEERSKQFVPKMEITSKIKLKITFYFEAKTRKTDLDNRAKAAQDVMMRAGLFKDDSQIDKVTLERGPNVSAAYMTVELAYDEQN